MFLLVSALWNPGSHSKTELTSFALVALLGPNHLFRGHALRLGKTFCPSGAVHGANVRTAEESAEAESDQDDPPRRTLKGGLGIAWVWVCRTPPSKGGVPSF